MITVTYPPGRYLELRNCYEWREFIKALGSPPDVLWDGARKAWLVDARLFDKLASVCGQHLAPIAADVFMRLPEAGDAPPRKMTPKEKAIAKREAGKVGKAIVEYAHQQKG